MRSQIRNVPKDAIRFMDDNFLYMTSDKIDEYFEVYLKEMNFLGRSFTRTDRFNSRISGMASYNKKFRQCKENAIRRQIKFELSFEQWKELVCKNCLYCGIEPSLWNMYMDKDGQKRSGSVTKDGAIKANIYINGVDRADNSVGYVLGNCVPCCRTCNVMKMTLSQKQFLEHIRKIAAFNSPASLVAPLPKSITLD